MSEPDALVKTVVACDQEVRKAIMSLYTSLEELKDHKIAVELLSEHVAIIVEMINKYKGNQ